MLSNAYFLAKFRFDTAKNEPAKNLHNFAKFANFAGPPPGERQAFGEVCSSDLCVFRVEECLCSVLQEVPRLSAGERTTLRREK